MCDMTNHDIESRLGSIEDKLDKLIVTVRGSSDYGSRGLSPRVTELEKRVIRIETIMNRAMWIAIGAGGVGAGIAEVIKAILGGG